MRFYADLHIHSKYSRATSQDCDLENLLFWGRKKGITVIGTGDFTHPAWIKEIKEKLVPAEPGFFRLRPDLEKQVLSKLPSVCQGETRFMLSVEISTIYKKGDKVRKIHHLIYAPSIEKAEKINQKLGSIGNIRSDGRPILGLDSRHLLEIVLEAGPDCFLVPAHIWTPWFAVLGSKSGFDRVADCYGDLAEYVFAVETGLSSDPEMNWRISSLDRYRLVSNSDAHSPQKLGREASVFDTNFSYDGLRSALETGKGYAGTTEFFPEEGKYHMDGHRKCEVRLHPRESRKLQGLCPECHKPLTLGVMYRVEELSDRPEKQIPANAHPFQCLIPLPEIISEIAGTGVNSQKVTLEYEKLIAGIGPELSILNDLSLEEVKRSGSSVITEAVSRMRKGQVIREAGYDGEYGRIKLFDEQELKTRFLSPVLLEVGQQSLLKKKSILPPAKKIEAAPRKLIPLNLSEKFSHVLDLLDEEQQKAAQSVEGPTLIIAGPGSGKTRTLMCRLAHLILNHSVSPASCLTLTFSRRAVQEMKERLTKLLPVRSNQIPVFTFHGLAYRMIDENHLNLGLHRGFRLAIETEREEILKKATAWPAKKVQKIIKEISTLKRQSETAQSGSDLERAVSIFADLREKEGLLDYDDLMILAVQILEEDKQLGLHYQQKYRWISVDEYQDIDAFQYRFIRALVPQNGNLCVIGDPDQSIYRFRGSDVSFFLNFEKDFPGTRKFNLNHNYRSGASILTASSQMLAPSALIEGRMLESLISEPGRIVLHEAPSEKAEAEFMVHTIEQLIGGSSFYSIDTGRSEGGETNYGFSDFAVLYRTEIQSGILEKALDRSGIPYQRRGHDRLADYSKIRTLLSKADGSDAASFIESIKNDPTFDSAFIEKLELLSKSCDEDLKLFTSEIQLAADIDTWDERADRVSLLTLHASKGLEFAVVFIAGCEDGLIPLHWGTALDEDQLSEERRLFYVGMTRSKEKLYLTHAKKRWTRGKVKEQNRSPFIDPIETRLLEKSSIRLIKKAKEPQLDLF